MTEHQHPAITAFHVFDICLNFRSLKLVDLLNKYAVILDNGSDIACLLLSCNLLSSCGHSRLLSLETRFTTMHCIFIRTRDILYLIPYLVPPCQNVAATLPITCNMVSSSGVLVVVADSRRDEEEPQMSGELTSFYLHTSRQFFNFQTCSLQLQPKLTQVTSLQAIYQTLCSFFSSHKKLYTT